MLTMYTHSSIAQKNAGGKMLWKSYHSSTPKKLGSWYTWHTASLTSIENK